MTETTDPRTLDGHDIDGRVSQWKITGAEPLPAAGRLAATRVHLADGATYVLRSPRGRADEQARRALDNEIRVLARLTLAFGTWRPRPFPALIGYDMDSSEPWALVGDYRGIPAREATAALLGTGLMEFTGGLFEALAHLPLAEVVHGGIGLDTVYVSDGRIQLVSFDDAGLIGEPGPRRSGPMAPDQDMLASGLLLYEVFTGTPASSTRPDLSDVPLLASQLPDLFAERRARPSAVAVMERLGRRDFPSVDGPDELDAGRAAFEEARRRKLPPEPPTVRTRSVPPPARPVRAVAVPPSASPPKSSPTSRSTVVLLTIGVLLVLAAVAYFALEGMPW
ncbi:hypothetical protein [Amycolatopsis tolypomycina]|uniref:hypothetical protein n=1 Tax=Amycolatopsis tolypomycina TaxID=208445 RepID=UPI0033AB127A